ncbi:hypothetical protein DL96DRAFT_1560579 [Flagelloscypha sp. PMI_526]|nr:hypothetical protein DL96DRAFT_1560579 [Flagelloscypha sp. PMI_526]
MSAITSVIIVGASGNLEPTLASALVAARTFTVTVYVREESKAEFHSEVNVVKGNYTRTSLEAALKGQEAVICTVGFSSGGLTIQKIVVEAAVTTGIKRFFPSDFGVDITEETLGIFPTTQEKQEVTDYLISREDLLSWTVIRTGAFFDWSMKAGFAGFDLVNHKSDLLDGGVAKFHATNLSTIARAVVAILSSPESYEKTKNQIVSIFDHIVSQRDILATVERITGEEWEATHVDTDNVTKDAMGTSAEPFAMIRALLFGRKGLGRLGGEPWNDALGLPKHNLEEDLRLILDGKSP